MNWYRFKQYLVAIGAMDTCVRANKIVSPLTMYVETPHVTKEKYHGMVLLNLQS